MPSVYKLYYFPVRGRAEVSRLMFAYGGISYEDVRIAGEEWMKFKPKTPNGQMPVLEIDGTMFPQSSAIEEYIAELVGLNGENINERLLINVLCCNQQDIIKRWPYGEQDDKVKKQKEDKVLDEDFVCFFQKIEEDMVKRGCKNGYYLNQISRADFFILNTVDFICGRRPNFLEKYPKVKALVEKIRSEEKVKKWLDIRPQSSF